MHKQTMLRYKTFINLKDYIVHTLLPKLSYYISIVSNGEYIYIFVENVVQYIPYVGYFWEF